MRGWDLVGLVLLGACAGRGTIEREDRPDGSDPSPDVPSVGPGQAPLGDPGPTPEICSAHPIAGVGTTWLETDPTSAKQRHLRCLSDGTAELSGRFVHVLHETNLPAVAGTSVE